LTTEAPLGEVALLRNKKVALAQRVITFRGKKELCDNAFLKYYFQSNVGQASLLSRAQGSTVEGIKSAELRELEVSLPPLPEQKSIASILNSLDDKIDLLHRQNKTLEALAETLFRQWFVEEAEERWTHGSLGDISDFYNGKSRPESCEGGSVPIYGGNGILGYTVQSNAEGKSIVIGRVGAYCGSLYIENKPIWITDNALSAKPKKERYTSYLFYLLKSLNLNQMAEGSSHPLITQTLLNTIEVIIPSNEKLHAFCAYADKTLEKLFFNQAQIHTLTRLRNTLLPKLMSGEVRVTDVERFVETAP
jgi:type I restriction enzyme S subunit